MRIKKSKNNIQSFDNVILAENQEGMHFTMHTNADVALATF